MENLFDFFYKRDYNKRAKKKLVTFSAKLVPFPKKSSLFAFASEYFSGYPVLCSNLAPKQKNAALKCNAFVAGETRFEHATGGFGDRCSTVEPLP